MKRTFVLLLFVSLFFAVDGNAQGKFGHLYSQKILDSLPAYKEGQKKIEDFVKEKTGILETMQKEIETQYQKIESEKSTMDQFVYETKVRDLQQQAQRLQETQAQYENDIQIYQARVMEPIIRNLQKAIKAVGDKEKFTYIFEGSETAAGIPVYTGGGIDITPQVNKELHSYYVK